jgi:hypothetical protein
MPRRKVERIRIELRPLREHYERFVAAAGSVDMSVAHWLIEAGLARLRNWKDPLTGEQPEAVRLPRHYRSGWSKDIACYVCGMCHDPAEQHPEAPKATEQDELRMRVTGIDCGSY